MALKKFLMIGVVAAVLVACGDDASDKSPVQVAEESSSSVDEVLSSSVNVEESSSSFESEGLSSSVESETSSSSEKSTESSSGKNTEPAEVSSCSAAEGSSSSTTVESSSCSVKAEQSSSSAKAEASSSSVKVQESSSSVKVEESSSSAKTDASSSSEKPAESSSSEKVAESSSSEVSSSSVVQSCKTKTEDNCIYGTLYDERDGKTYKTVKIGEQWWMAENLSYEADSLGFINRSVCHYKSDTCKKYGRLYFWSAALDSVTTGCGNGVTCKPDAPIQGVCPEGWHIPTKAETEILLTNVGVLATLGEKKSGLKLMSGENWQSGCNGSDAYGFSALPSGVFSANIKDYLFMYDESYIMLSDEYSKSKYFVLEIKGPASLTGCDRTAKFYSEDKTFAVSVRCIKD